MGSVAASLPKPRRPHICLTVPGADLTAVEARLGNQWGANVSPDSGTVVYDALVRRENPRGAVQPALRSARNGAATMTLEVGANTALRGIANG